MLNHLNTIGLARSGAESSAILTLADYPARARRGLAHSGDRLGRFSKIAFALVFFEGHGKVHGPLTLAGLLLAFGPGRLASCIVLGQEKLAQGL
jgi:hypothetical protein